MKYTVNWNYRSSLGGPWMAGDVIELDDPLAEAVNRDSPGVLGLYVEKASKPLGKKQDRQIKQAEMRVDET